MTAAHRHRNAAGHFTKHAQDCVAASCPERDELDAGTALLLRGIAEAEEREDWHRARIAEPPAPDRGLFGFVLGVSVLLGVVMWVMIFLAVSALGAFGQTAPSGPTCGEWPRLAHALTSKYDESQTWAGLAADGHQIEIWQNAGSGSWTMLRVRPDGQACIVATGEGGGLTSGFAGKGDPA